jgi:membrane fusion protein, multidrug efflux system
LKKLALCLSLLFVFIGCSDPPPMVEQSPRSVVVHVVESNTNQSVPIYAGLLRAKQRSDLSFLQSGQVIEVNKELGQSFRQGEVLAKINNTELALSVDERKANLLDAQTEQTYAQLNYDRLFTLQASGAISDNDIDSAIARLNSAQARVEAYEAAVGQVQKRLSETILVAPYDGQVVERLIEPSQSVGAGQAVYRVTGDEGGFEAIVNVPVSALAFFVTGLQTSLLIRPNALEKIATVFEVGNAAGLSGLYPILLNIEDSAGLRPGLRVEVQGQVNNLAKQSIVIPLSAYQVDEAEQGSVFIVNITSGIVSKQQVFLGEVTDAGIEVVKGLKVGDIIVARGQSMLRDGDKVTPLGLGVGRFNE